MRQKNFFGKDDLYIEKYFKNPRHIEVQIMSGKNKTVHLGGKRLFGSKKAPEIN